MNLGEFKPVQEHRLRIAYLEAISTITAGDVL
jgi:hypothetical protein